MARKEATIVIGPEGGRDAGRKYVIKEVAVYKFEDWVRRGVRALIRAGILNEQSLSIGLPALMGLGIQAIVNMPDDEARFILDESLVCIHIVPQSGHPRPIGPQFGQDDIEELGTLWKLRLATLELHVGFSLGEYLTPRTQDSPAPVQHPTHTQT
jgi:hypothetical protein